VALVVAACADEEEGASPTETPEASETPMTSTLIVTASPGLEIVHMHADFFVDNEASLATLLGGNDVIIGRVTGVALPYDPRGGYGGVAPPTAPPGVPVNPLKNYTPTKEEVNRPPGRPFTVWTMEILDPGDSAFEPGDVIYVAKVGGIWEGQQIQTEGDPLLEVGSTYLLPIFPSTEVSDLLGSGYWSSGAWTEFVVEGEHVRVSDDGWLTLSAIRELNGKPVHEALQTMLAASASWSPPPD